MTIIVQISSALRSYCDGAPELELSARTVGAVLEQIEQEHPELYRCVCNETGAVRQHVNLFVNSSLVGDKQRLDTKLAEGDVLTFFQAVSGG